MNLLEKPPESMGEKDYFTHNCLSQLMNCHYITNLNEVNRERVLKLATK